MSVVRQLLESVAPGHSFEVSAHYCGDRYCADRHARRLDCSCGWQAWNPDQGKGRSRRELEAGHLTDVAKEAGCA